MRRRPKVMADPFLFVDKKKVLIICAVVFFLLVLAMSIALGITFSVDYYGNILLGKDYNLTIYNGKIYEINRFNGYHEVEEKKADYFWSIVAITDDWRNDGTGTGERVVVTKYKTISLAKEAEEYVRSNGQYFKRRGTILIYGTKQGVSDVLNN